MAVRGERDIQCSKNKSAIKNFRVLNLALPPTLMVPLSLGHLCFPSYKTGGKNTKIYLPLSDQRTCDSKAL